MMEWFSMRTAERYTITNISEQVATKAKVLERKGASACFVFIPHTPAAVTIKDYSKHLCGLRTPQVCVQIL